MSELDYRVDIQIPTKATLGRGGQSQVPCAFVLLEKIPKLPACVLLWFLLSGDYLQGNNFLLRDSQHPRIHLYVSYSEFAIFLFVVCLFLNKLVFFLENGLCIYELLGNRDKF